MRALILAAGQGTRLRPLTDTVPKALVPLRGRPLLEWQRDAFASLGIDDITVVGGYRADAFETLGFATVRNARFETTNMVESLFAARDLIASRADDLVVSYGDIVFTADNLATVLRAPGDVAVMIDHDWRALWEARSEDPLADAETLRLDAGGRILELGRRPRSLEDIEGQYTGLFRIAGDRTQALLDFYDALDRTATYEGRVFEQMYMTTFLQLLIDAGWDVREAPVSGGWLEVDTVDDLGRYERMAAAGTLDRFIRLG